MCTLVLTPQLSFNMSPLANEMGKYVFGEPVMIVGADVTHWAKGYVSSLVKLVNLSCYVYIRCWNLVVKCKLF